MLKRWLVAAQFLSSAIVFAFALESQAVTIYVTETSPAQTVGGAIFVPNANPTSPSTGTGVFQPFVRIQGTGSSQQAQLSSFQGNGNGNNNNNGNGNRNGTGNSNASGNSGSNWNSNGPSQGPQRGFNTDANEPSINFDTKGGRWTHSITLGDVGTVTQNGTRYFEFALDANEPGRAGSYANEIDITDIQLFVGPGLSNPESIPLGTSFLSNGVLDLGSNGHLVYRLPTDTIVTLDASICDTPGQCGSGHGDMTLLIPVANLPAGWNTTDNVVFYTVYDRAGGASGGFEEWRHGTGPPIPEPRAALAFAAGALVVGWATRRARR